MQKRINFGVNEEITFSNELIKGVLLDINPINASSALCAISNLNKVSIDITVIRENGKETQLIKGWLDDVLHTLYEGSEIYSKITAASVGLGYTIPLDFGNNLNLSKKDRLVIRINAQNTAFTGVVLSTSSINVESIPATSISEGGYLAKVSAHSIGTDETNVDKELPENTFKVVLALDYTAPYGSSSKSKVTDVTVKDGSRILKKVSENLLFSENVLLNVHSVPNMLVAYQGGLIRNGRVETQLTIGADVYAKILTLSAVLA